MHENKIQMNERHILDKVIEESSPNLAHVLASAVFGFGFFHAPFNWKYLSRNQLYRIPPSRHFLPLIPTFVLSCGTIRLSARDNFQKLIYSEKQNDKIPDSHVKNMLDYYKIEDERERNLKISKYVKENGVRDLNPIRQKLRYLNFESFLDYSKL